MSIDPKLDELGSLCAQLNEAADSVNETIEAVEDRLTRMGVGVTVWLDERYDDFIDRSGWNTFDSPEGPHEQETAWALGYAKLGEKEWRLAVRRVELDRQYGETSYAITSRGPVSGLLGAPRFVRVHAVTKLEPLVDVLIARTRVLVNGLASTRASSEASAGSGSSRDAERQSSTKASARDDSNDSSPEKDDTQIYVMRQGKRVLANDDERLAIKAYEAGKKGDLGGAAVAVLESLVKNGTRRKAR